MTTRTTPTADAVDAVDAVHAAADAADAADRAVTDARRRHLALLAHAPREALQRLAQPVLSDHRFETLRAPETGLVMLRARIGNRGDRFHLGEVTVTRCVLRHRPAAGPPTAGVGYVLGRDAERAQWIAGLDALLQVPALHALLAAQVLAPLGAQTQAERAARRAGVQASRVSFQTLQAQATP